MGRVKSQKRIEAEQYERQLIEERELRSKMEEKAKEQKQQDRIDRPWIFDGDIYLWNEKKYADNIAQILSIRFDDNPQDALNGLLSNIYLIGWQSDYASRAGWKYADVCLKKYREGVLTLQANNNPLADYHLKEYEKLKRKRFFKKNRKLLISGILTFISILIILLGVVFYYYEDWGYIVTVLILIIGGFFGGIGYSKYKDKTGR